MNGHDAITLLSGGLDSTTLAYWLQARGYDVHALSFDYGQRHKKELGTARNVAHMMGARHEVIILGAERVGGGLSPLATVLGDSVLVNQDRPVPDGHYADENMKQTVVPNRNAIMLSIAYGVAVGEKADVVAFAAHAGDHAIYPDCRPGFVSQLDHALATGNAWNEGDLTPEIMAPFLDMSKGEIAVQAHLLGVPISDTWSCYKGGAIHCGTCGTCYERREALGYAAKVTGKADPTMYLDSTTHYEAPDGDK